VCVKKNNFNILVYGFASVEAVVTRLIKPVQGYLHQLGVRSGIYIDDGQVLDRSKEEVEAAMRLSVKVFQLAGWNLQWRKTELTAKQEVQYLGVLLDLAQFQYKAPPGKLRRVQ
jgi:hypothetical protein